MFQVMIRLICRYRLCLAVILALASGCSKDGSDGGGKAGTGDSQTETGPGGPGSEASSAAQKKSLTGRWLLVASPLDKANDLHLAVLEIQKNKSGAFEARVLDSPSEVFPDAKVNEVEASGDRLRIELAVGEDGLLDVRGRLVDGVIRADAPTQMGVVPITLVPTRDDRVRTSDPVVRDHADEFQAALESTDQMAQLERFARKHPDSPLSLTAYRQILRRARSANLDRKTIERLASEFWKLAETWGVRIARMSRFEVGESLAVQGHLPELALQILEETEKGLTDQEKNELSFRLPIAKGLAESYLQYRLAREKERAGELDEALQLYAELAVIPGIDGYLQLDDAPPPTKAVEQLWKQQHGDTEQLPSYLDAQFRELVEGIVSEPAAAPAEFGTRTSLIELFTGAQCPPCAAADMATAALESTYPKSAVIVLRYHEHNPGPDPLTSPAAEARFDYYQGFGTPMVFLNGQYLPNIAGPPYLAEMQYGHLRKTVAPLLEEQTDIELELTADLQGEQLTLAANVAGLTNVPETLRLRLALAEDGISYNAPNGIRMHEMVVRTMPGGVDGIAPADGKLAYAETLSLDELRKSLAEYLDTYDRQFSVETGTSVFSSKPLDLDDLHLVAFVQDDNTKEVLQAAAVPIVGAVQHGPVPVQAPVPAQQADLSGPEEANGPQLPARP